MVGFHDGSGGLGMAPSNRARSQSSSIVGMVPSGKVKGHTSGHAFGCLVPMGPSEQLH